MNSEYASDISFLKSTLEYVRVLMSIYVYIHIFVTTFAGSSVLNVYLVSESPIYIYNLFTYSCDTTPNMQEYGFSLTRILPYSRIFFAV